MSTQLIYPTGVDSEIKVRTEDFFEVVLFSQTEEPILELLQAGICLEASNPNLRYPLHQACVLPRLGDIVCKTILALGADTEVQDNVGRTPLHVAALCGHVEAIKSLVVYGANLEARDNEGKTPLFTPINSHSVSIPTLLELGADIEARDNEGRTPLFFAIERKDTAAADLLLAKGANIYAKANAHPDRQNLAKGFGVISPDVSAWERQYDAFIHDPEHASPKTVEDVYHLLSVFPLSNFQAPVARDDHLHRIFLQAKWQNQQHAETIIDKLRDDGLKPESVESLRSLVASQYSQNKAAGKART